MSLAIKPNWVDGAFFIGCSSLFLLVVSGYSIGTHNHIEQLPMVLKLLDPDYLRNDFFVQASTEFGPRYYYSRFMAFISNVFGLENAFFYSFFSSLFLMILATYFVGYDLFNRSHVVGMLSVAFSTLPTVITLGWTTGFFQADKLIPAQLVASLVMLSVWAGVSGRPMLAASLACISMLFHPLWGMEAGLLSVFTALIVYIINREEPKKLRDAVVAGFVLVLCYAVFFHGRMNATIDDDVFVNIVARFRHPHHYVPSTWWWGHYATAIGFLGLYVLAWVASRSPDQRHFSKAQVTLIPIATILLTWIGGFFFVEVMPSRLWTTAQVFRLSTLINWLVWIVVVGTAVVIIRQALDKRGISIKRDVLSSLKIRLSGYRKLTITFLGITCAALVLRSLFHSISLKHVMVFGALCLLVTWFHVIRNDAIRRYLPVLGIGIVSALWITNHLYLVGIDSLVRSPRIYIEGDEMSRYLAEKTPKDAVLVTPPNRGDLRVTAKRALVCDFKAFPFQDWAMFEWRKRMTDCYGEVDEAGFGAKQSMDKNYRSIDDNRLRDLSQQYGATHAVLYADTETSHEALFSNNTYKLIKTN